MKKDKCGVYEILCRVSGKSYVGSSVQIYVRWAQHRRLLRKGTHPSPRLQRAWSKHGEENFHFSVLEECAREGRFAREQHYLDMAPRDYNSMPKVTVITREMRKKMVDATRAYKASITHCPRGHEYDEANTYLNAKGHRICRKCNAERVAKVYASETPEQREARLQRMALYSAKEEQRRKRAEYAAAHKAEKAAYDRARKQRMASMRKLADRSCLPTA